MMTKDEVIEIAKNVFDPEIPVDIWNLGLVYDIEIDEAAEKVAITMSLTTQNCPAAQSIPNDFKEKLMASGKIKEADVQLVFEPAWTPQRISQEGKKKLGIEE